MQSPASVCEHNDWTLDFIIQEVLDEVHKIAIFKINWSQNVTLVQGVNSHSVTWSWPNERLKLEIFIRGANLCKILIDWSLTSFNTPSPSFFSVSVMVALKSSVCFFSGKASKMVCSWESKLPSSILSASSTMRVVTVFREKVLQLSRWSASLKHCFYKYTTGVHDYTTLNSPSWSSNNNVRSLRQLSALGNHVHPAHNGGHPQTNGFSHNEKLVRDLNRKYTNYDINNDYLDAGLNQSPWTMHIPDRRVLW